MSFFSAEILNQKCETGIWLFYSPRARYLMFYLDVPRIACLRISFYFRIESPIRKMVTVWTRFMLTGFGNPSSIHTSNF